MNKKIKKIAVLAAKNSGEILVKYFDKFDRGSVMFKSGHEILTKADLASNKAIIKEVKKNFPDHQILSEETGDNKNKSDYLWIIDPLDGTTNFSIHNPLWAVSIGVAYKGKIILGVVYSPLLDELYIAELGEGATRNGKKIKVSKTKKGSVINTFCHGSREKDIKRAVNYFSKQKLNDFDCRQMGSASIELAFTACGRVESIAIPGAHSWDVAAGVLLVREAGGKVTDFFNKKWSLKSEDMLASNSKIHKDLLKVLDEV